MTFGSLILIGFTISFVIMIASWILANFLNFYSFVDVSWAYGIGLISLAYAFFGSGHFEKRFLVLIISAIWSLRLGTFILLRLKEKFPVEDKRYGKLKQKWNGKIKEKFLIFFIFQGISQPILCMPFLLASTNPNPISWIELTSLMVCLIGIIGESTADFQMRLFKKNPENKNLVCNKGLWMFSRHPNYFFEWVIWCGISILGISSSHGYLSLISPILMFLLLNFVTGVPPSEEQSILSRGDLYREYQKKTNRFFPWFSKKT